MKKFLSLVLALVMTMSLVTVSAGAKDFTDSSKINYSEAVDVMSAVKVIDGYAEGDFRPTATLTRGAAAKIICNLILGPTTASALVADAAPYKDVPVNHTFAGYIAYCQKTGIISGYADGTFKPANTLTGYAFMKMLLGALGYDSAIEGYTGANWSIAVAKQAINAGLNNSLKGSFNGVKAVTREEACLYAFNTLKATMVEYDKNSTVTVGNITIKDTSDAKEKTCVKGSGNDGNIDKDGKVQFAEEYFGDLKGIDTTDEFERPATQWKVKSTDVGTYTHTADATYTKKVEAGDIYKDLGLGSTLTKADVTIYVDGVEDATNAPALDIKKSSTTKVGQSGNGVLTEVFYDDDADTAVITQINTYVGTVTKTVKATDKKDAYVVVAPESTVKAGFQNQFETDEKFDDDAYVLFTYSYKDGEDAIESVALATKVSGVVTRAENDKKNGNIKDAKSLTIDGTVYKDSVKVAGDMLGDISVDETYDIYLDAYGYMIYVERIDEIGDYALLVAAQGSGTFQENKALLVFADGTSKLVDTKKNYAKPENLDMVKANGKPYTGSTNNTIVTYKENSDGTYTLRAVSSKQDSGKYNITTSVVPADGTTGKIFEMKNDKAGIKVGSTTVTANSASQFVVREAADLTEDVLAGDDWDAYTGIKNAPDITAAATADDKDVNVYYYCKDGKMVTVMFVLPNAEVDVDGSVNKQIFFADDASNLIHVKDADYYEYTAIVNGEIKTVKVDSTVSGAKALSGKIYKSYTVDKDGYITKVTPYGAADKYTTTNDEKGVITGLTGIDKTSKDYTVKLGLKADGSYKFTITVDDEAKIFYINDDDEISESSYKALAKDEKAKVYAYVDDYMVQTLIVYEQKDNSSDSDVSTGKITATTLTKKADGTLHVDWTMSEAVTGGHAVAEFYRVNNGVSYLFDTAEYNGDISVSSWLDGTKAVNVDGAYYAKIVVTDASDKVVDSVKTEEVNFAH